MKKTRFLKSVKNCCFFLPNASFSNAQLLMVFKQLFYMVCIITLELFWVVFLTLKTIPIDMKEIKNAIVREVSNIGIQYGIDETTPQKDKDDSASNNFYRRSKTSRTFSHRLKNHLRQHSHPTQSNHTLSGYIWQFLDNFNSNDTRQWKQFFFYNLQHWDEGEGPNFLLLGGEGPISKSDVLEGVWMMMVWAKRHKAAAYSLEHRFYGRSLATGSNISTENLKYLSSRQALVDTARFIQSVNLKRNITNPQWILFGGSYAGNLAALFRLRYPELVLAAVASSAPLHAIVDFKEYYPIVQKAISQYGQNSCLNIINSFFLKAKELLSDKNGRAKLGFCPELAEWDDEKDSVQFFDDQFSEIGIRVQDDSLNHSGISELCVDFTNHLHRINDSGEVFDMDECLNSTYAEYIEMLKDTSPNWARCWHWQQCTEFGFFKSIYSNDQNMFGNVTISMEHLIGTCTDVFGAEYNLESVNAAVNSTKLYYGKAEDFNGTNTIFIRGSEDPWHIVGIRSNNGPFISLFVEGISHCRDMLLPPSDSHYPALDWAHNVIDMEISNWLSK